MRTKWDICELATGTWKEVGEKFVEDLSNKDNINEIMEYPDGDIEVHYVDGGIKNYQKIHGNFVFNY